MSHVEYKIQEVTLDKVESILLEWLLLDYFIKTHRRLRTTTASNLLHGFWNIYSKSLVCQSMAQKKQ